MLELDKRSFSSLPEKKTLKVAEDGEEGGHFKCLIGMENRYPSPF